MILADLTRPREIADATAIPRLGRSDVVFLISTDQVDEARLRRAGARAGSKGWFIPRSSDIDLDALDPNLPRYARRAVVPEIVDLIPETAWCASLANMLMASSWKVLRDVTAIRAGGCEECGWRDGLECHEVWAYDDDACIQTLIRLSTLCGPCHETRHLGFASVRGRYREAIGRLAAINRLEAGEQRAYGDIVFERFERRSEVEWAMDLSILSGLGLRLKKSFASIGPGVVLGTIGKRSVEAVIKGVEIDSGSKALLLA